MEKISDFLKEIGNRITNPFILSFIIAWLFTNWRIPIALLFYKQEQLKLDGYHSYFDLIKNGSSVSGYVAYPLVIAALYTFIFPVFRNLIFAFNTWIATWGETWNLEIAEKGKVSAAKYISIVTGYKEKTKMIEKIIEEKQVLVEENDKLTNEKMGMSNQLSDLQQSNTRQKALSHISYLDGDWNLKIRNGGAVRMSRVVISNGDIMTDDMSGHPFMAFRIVQYFYNQSTSEFLIRFEDKGFNGNLELYQTFMPQTSSYQSLKNVNDKGPILELVRLFF